MKHRIKWLLACAALAAACGIATAQTVIEPKCADLLKSRIPNVVITQATRVAALPAGQPTGNLPGETLAVPLPANCLVRGTIDQRVGLEGRTYGIGFELRLPEKWEHRFLFQGGGGMDGVVRPALGQASGANRNPGLARGFAVVSTDAGHQGNPQNPAADSTFGRDQQARIDNAYRSIERVTAVAKALVQQYYGEIWRHAYFAGCSNGGRQGLISAQRFPTDFDGIVSGAPAFRVTHAAIGSAWETIAFTQIAPEDSNGNPILSRAFTDADLKLVADAVLRECDTLDGLKDGLVMNPGACHFDPAVLQCPGANTEGCLTAKQVLALKKVFEGPKNSRGEVLYSDWPYDPGIAAPGWRMLKLGTSQTAMPNSADVTLMFSGLKGYFMTPYDPNFDPMHFDFDRDTRRVEETAALQDPTGTQLSTFIGRGGKLILYHGMADPFFSASDTTRYYQELLKDNEAVAQGQSWARLFLVPGMNHCSGGPALDNFDALAAIVNWVEKGAAPERLDATGAAFPGRSRPLCAFPAYARYKGTGATEDAENFECK